MTEKKPRRRGPRPTFSRDDIIVEALSQGVGVFTLSSVARGLGVTHTALYREIDSHYDLLLAAIQRIVGSMEWPDETTDWREAAHLYADNLWKVLSVHPGADNILLTTPGAAAPAASAVRKMIQNFASQGVPANHARMLIDAITELVCAAHIEVTALHTTVDRRGEQVEARALQVEQWADTPDIAPDDEWREDAWYRHKIDLLVAGVEVLSSRNPSK